MPQVGLRRDQNYNLVQQTYDEKAFRGEYVANNLVYAAFALPGSDPQDRVWQLKKLTYTGTDLTAVTWPQLDGKASTDYAFAWDDRATYTYS
jgi:hypothetical protein